MKKFYECQVRNTNNAKYFQNQQNAVDFATKDTIEYYRIFKGVELELYMTDIPVHGTGVNLYFRKKGDKDTYVVSYIQIRKFED